MGDYKCFLVLALVSFSKTSYKIRHSEMRQKSSYNIYKAYLKYRLYLSLKTPILMSRGNIKWLYKNSDLIELSFSLFLYIYKYIYIYIYIYICMHVCVRVHVCVCMSMSMWKYLSLCVLVWV